MHLRVNLTITFSFSSCLLYLKVICCCGEKVPDKLNHNDALNKIHSLS